ncbi:MAG: hypothetical protein AAGB24_13985 [Bacteroidota bacterium]
MKRQLLYVMLLFITPLTAQILDTPPVIPSPEDLTPRPGDYLDPAIIVPVYTEAWATAAALEAYQHTNTEVLKMAGVNAIEYLSREWLPSYANPILSLNYTDLCDHFYVPFSSERIKCQTKRAYLIEAARIANELVNWPTSERVNNGVIDQIGVKYTNIINTITYELELMEIERDKRSLARMILD